MTERLCELKIKDKDSVDKLIFALTSNGHEVQISPVFKEFPHQGIDHWAVRIGDKVEDSYD